MWYTEGRGLATASGTSLQGTRDLGVDQMLPRMKASLGRFESFIPFHFAGADADWRRCLNQGSSPGPATHLTYHSSLGDHIYIRYDQV